MNNFIDIKKLYFRILRLTRELSTVERERNEWRERCKKLVVENNINEDLILRTDKESFRSIFSNLLNNAIKYSPKGSKIIFNAAKEKKSIVISIKDNGYGIEKNSIKRVFERFYRSSKARAHTKGTGLGLALVKQLSSRIGANVKVESQINVGSEFFVSFQDK